MSNSVRPHRRQPTRLPHPWDSPGKNTGVGCHFLLQCMEVKSESEVAQSCPTLSDPMDCSLPGSSIPGIFQARVLEWGAIAFSIEKLVVTNGKSGKMEVGNEEVQSTIHKIKYWCIRFHQNKILLHISSVQFSHSVMSDSLRPHELQHTRPPCPSSSHH